MKEKKPKDSIRVDVQTPVGNWTHDFEKTTKISEVIQEILLHFDLAPGNYQMRLISNGEVLQPDRPLVSYHIEDDTNLELFPDQGGGV